jgi:hypothetical protein
MPQYLSVIPTASSHVNSIGAAAGAAVVCGALVGMYGMADEIDRQRRVGPELRGDALWEVRQLRNRICAVLSCRPSCCPRLQTAVTTLTDSSLQCVEYCA